MTAPNIPKLRRLLARPLATFSDADRHDLIVALRNDAPALLDLLDDMAAAIADDLFQTPRCSQALARYRAMTEEL